MHHHTLVIIHHKVSNVKTRKMILKLEILPYSYRRTAATKINHPISPLSQGGGKGKAKNLQKAKYLCSNSTSHGGINKLVCL